jgi:hypothetical protein
MSCKYDQILFYIARVNEHLETGKALNHCTCLVGGGGAQFLPMIKFPFLNSQSVRHYVLQITFSTVQYIFSYQLKRENNEKL